MCALLSTICFPSGWYWNVTIKQHFGEGGMMALTVSGLCSLQLNIQYQSRGMLCRVILFLKT